MCSRFLPVNATRKVVRVKRVAVLATEQTATRLKVVLLRSKRLGVSHCDLLLLLHFLSDGLCSSGRIWSRGVLEVFLHFLQSLEVALASLVLIERVL